MRIFHILSLLLLGGTAFTQSAIADDRAYVQVRDAKVRSQAKIWAPSVASVAYGDALTKLDEESGWSKVKTVKGTSGFIPTSALTARKVVFTSHTAAGGGGVDATDAILAGKGFDQSVEKNFAGRGGDFQAVNHMERIVISDAELRDFVAASGFGGGR